eukprot:CAMPEP_0196782392 /NCGR_PEP_ID=MMETSP1104-20130614/11311_1 /TAXON_ID=33652 /ORGANISM="Cafeteria sp., Strain Caron Lab Isolate" /LENGTH=408 /DNA_ID=CAMNT_0042152625 /DNA_START=1 /DNA_END=1227 /DNA_ORIENTATION=+
MRALGYSRMISVENFRKPNFQLVADILYWMVQRLDPHARVSDVIDSEYDRVEFLQAVGQTIASKARIKLNLKRLYAADGHAVRELLKVASLLNKAMKAASAEDEGAGLADVPVAPPKLQDLKHTRRLASEITERGAKLHDLLGVENDLQRDRDEAIRFLDAAASNLDSGAEHRFIETKLQEFIGSTRENLAQLKRQLEDLTTDEQGLQSKIKKRETELVRSEKRLREIHGMVPVYMAEYKKLEEDLQQLHEVYVERFRNLSFLEHELDVIHKAEKERMEENARARKRMQDKLKKKHDAEERGDMEFGDDITADLRRRSGAALQRPEAAYAKQRLDARAGRVVGDMKGGSPGDSEDESDSLGTDSDLDDESDGQVSMGDTDTGSEGTDSLVDDDGRGRLDDDDESDDGF